MNNEKLNPKNTGKIHTAEMEAARTTRRNTGARDNRPTNMMSDDSTLAGLMAGLQAIVGPQRFLLALQREGWKSAEADWAVISKYRDFRQGFKAIADISEAAGWGKWTLLTYNNESKECRFRVTDCWETRYQKALGVCWGCGMLMGKLAGYCSKHFGTNCWTTQTAFAAWGEQYDEFVVKPSTRSIERELGSLIQADEALRTDMSTAIRTLQKEMADRKSAEEALRKSEANYRLLVENLNDGVFIVQDGLVKSVNTIVARMMGTTKEGAIGHSIIESIHPDDIELVLDRHRRRLEGETGLPSLYEFRVIRGDGEIFWVELNTVLIEWEGRPATLNMLRDITARKQMEEENRRLQEQLSRAEKMEALGTLAGGVAHDLNNVLGILVGYSELLLQKIDHTDKVLRPHLLNLMKGGERAAAIVQDLLTLARRGVPMEKVFNINTVIAEYQTTPEFEKLRSFHPNIRIETALAGELLNIKGSPLHVGKSLFNLLSNAMEAMPDGGIVSVATRNEYIDKPVKGYSDVKEGDYVVLSVSDTGAGISNKDLKHIFEPFYTKKVMGRSGTGLGLAVVWGTVKDHNGYIDVATKSNKGTTFTLYFPVSRLDLTQEQAVIPIADYMGCGETVLIVDDMEEQRILAAAMLEKLNYRPATAANCNEAIAYLRRQDTDLVLLDMIMDPYPDGLDTYRKILEIHPGQKAIIVSGYAETDRVRQAMELGAGAYVRKPYILEKLGTAVRQTIDKSD